MNFSQLFNFCDQVPSEQSCCKRVNSGHRELVKHPAFREISAINGEINRMNPKNLKCKYKM